MWHEPAMWNDSFGIVDIWHYSEYTYSIMSRKSSLNQIFEVENEYSIQFIKASGIICVNLCAETGYRENLKINILSFLCILKKITM